MDPNIVECDLVERDARLCVCKGGPTLEILKEVQRVYEERMELIEKVGGTNKLQMQTEALRSWVGDLVGQNTLLARTVEELEAAATSRLLLERRRHAEKYECTGWRGNFLAAAEEERLKKRQRVMRRMQRDSSMPKSTSTMVCELRAEAAALRRRLARKDSDLRGLVEVLRRLREFDYCTLEGIHFFDVTESDIFGSVEWREKKLEQGDTRRNIKQDAYKLKSNRRHRFL